MGNGWRALGVCWVVCSFVAASVKALGHCKILRTMMIRVLYFDWALASLEPAVSSALFGSVYMLQTPPQRLAQMAV